MGNTYCSKFGISMTERKAKIDDLATYWGCFNEQTMEIKGDSTELSAERCVILGIIDQRNRISSDQPLRLYNMKNLLVVDLDYFLEHLTDVLLAVKSIKNI